MKENIILAKKDNLGNIQKCCHGVVHIHIGSFSMRFKEQAFKSFALMVDKAFSHLMDETISEILSRQEQKKGSRKDEYHSSN